MTEERYQLEDAVLANYLPRNMFRFKDMDTSAPYLQAGVVTNDGVCYLLRFNLLGFPSHKPKVYVEEMLRTKSGALMNEISATNHTLTPYNGWTQLCHYNDDCWSMDVSLWKVYLKCRLWLEMYRAHLRTGKSMDYYLNHQQSKTTQL